MEQYNTIINLIILSVLSGVVGFTIAKTIYKEKNPNKTFVTKADLARQQILEKYTKI